MWQESLERNKPYYQKLFSPIEVPKLGDKDDVDPKTGKRTFSPTTYNRYVNDTNRADSAELLTETLQHDQGLYNVFKSFESQLDLSNPIAVVDAIRLNPKLRLAVGMHYVNKFIVPLKLIQIPLAARSAKTLIKELKS